MEPVFFSNIEKVEPELKQIAGQEKYLLIGTGELSDSLAFVNNISGTQYAHQSLINITLFILY